MAEAPRDIKMPAFSSDTDPDETGRRWQRYVKDLETRFRFFRITDTQDKVDALHIYGGEQLRELMDTLPNLPVPDGEDWDAYAHLTKKLTRYFEPQVNTDSARSRFERMNQLSSETVAQYHVRLRLQASKCAFANLEDSLRSKLLQSMTDGKLRREAMTKRYTLTQLLEHAANKEAIYRQATEIENSESVKMVHTKKRYPAQKRHRRPRQAPTASNSGHKSCDHCGTSHPPEPRQNCPAWGKSCNYCRKANHFEKVCRKKLADTQTPKTKNDRSKSVKAVHSETVDKYYSDSSDSDYVFQLEQREHTSDIRPTVAVRIGGVKGRVDADSCSTANLIDENRFAKLQNAAASKITLKPTATKLYAYAQKDPVPLVGFFETEVESVTTGKKTNAKFLVAKGQIKSNPLLSFKTSVELGVLSVTNTVTENGNLSADTTTADPVANALVSEFKDVFTGLGKHKYIKAELIEDKSVTPVAHKKRPMPYNLEKLAGKEESRLQSLSIVEDEPPGQATTWCTNPVCVPKPNNPDAIRYCSDMRVPNTAIKRPITEAMTVEDLKRRLNGAKVFSVLDMNEGYHQLELAESSRHLTTFYASSGKKMRYARLNYGTISAQDIFDKAMDDTIHDLKGVLHIRDDFIVYGSDDQSHDKALKDLLIRFRECGLTFNPRKCKFRLPVIKFFGFVFCQDGIKPDPSKVKALKEMAAPSNVSEIRSLLGMAQYSAQFIPNFSERTTALRNLTKNGVKWKWTSEEQHAFEDLRNALSEDTVLSFYETGIETKLIVDAGPHGLGLILLQNKPQGWKPIICASRSLTPVEERYSQTEREALAIRWACERCYIYLIGSRFTVETDHQPLLPLFNNPHSRPPMRIERWILYLQQFDFELKYKPGKYNAADYLSRHAEPLSERDTKHSDLREMTVKKLVHDTVPKALPLEKLREATANDHVLVRLRNLIASGNVNACKRDNDLKPFAFVFNELSIAENLIMRGNRIVVPEALQSQVITLCHEGHMGMVKTKQLLRSKVWFPGIDNKVERVVRTCLPCQACTQPVPSQRDPLLMTPTPEGPWALASADFKGPLPSGEYVLVVVDAYSRYPAVEIVTSTSAKSTIQALAKIFSTHGTPTTLRTDNGPPFQSVEFKAYSIEQGFTHHRVTPLWPEANGQVESFMRNVSKVIKTAHVAGNCWKRQMYSYLTNYRSTPHPSTGKTPYELTLRYDIRTKIPASTSQKLDDDVKRKDTFAKTSMKAYADAKRHTLMNVLKPGDTVLVKQKNRSSITTPFDPTPHKIEDVNGSAITARRSSDNKPITRNSSFFKKIDIDTPGLDTTVDTRELEDIELSESEDNVIEDTELKETTSEPVIETKSGRISKPPIWTKDYHM